MSARTSPPLVAKSIRGDVLAELIRRARDIDSGYRDVAQRLGQLYVFADEHGLATLTRSMDEVMRNASENERVMASILDELLVTAGRRQTRKT